MMTLYTALGYYRLNNRGLPSIIAGGTEHGMDTHELILWSSLVFRIMTYDELKMEFYEKERELHILGELDFDHYLNRLIMRRLIASGRDCTGTDALYELLGHLYVQSVPTSFILRAVTFFKVWLFKGVPFRQAALLFQYPKLDPIEKQVMELLHNKQLSTVELIQYSEKRKKGNGKYETMDCIFSDDRLPILSAVANLYLKQKVILDIL